MKLEDVIHLIIAPAAAMVAEAEETTPVPMTDDYGDYLRSLRDELRELCRIAAEYKSPPETSGGDRTTILKWFYDQTTGENSLLDEIFLSH